MITDPASLYLYRRFTFQLDLDGVTRAGFSEVGGLTSDGDVVDYRAGQLPGLSGYNRLVLRRGVTADRSLWDWRRAVLAGLTRRADGTITQLDAARRPLVRWTFHAGWPTKWEGPDFDAQQGGEVTIETLEIAHEGLKRCT